MNKTVYSTEHERAPVVYPAKGVVSQDSNKSKNYSNIKLCTIPKTTIDPYYRYKRPYLITSTQNKNNGLIILENLNIVADAINRDQNIVISYLKRKLNTTINVKNGKYSIRLSTNVDIDFDDLIENFIEENVICKKCGNPETFLQKNCIICKACGYRHSMVK
jgi:translation initiation factor 2 beta subunit (eIF-2beta)/eIF-5